MGRERGYLFSRKGHSILFLSVSLDIAKECMESSVQGRREVG